MHHRNESGLVGKIVLGIVIAFILILGGCLAVVGGVFTAVDDELNNNETTKVKKGEDASGTEVVLKVTDSKDAQLENVTYSDPDMNISQANKVKAPWEKRFSTDEDMSILGFTLNAQRGADGAGKITCSITVDGEVVTENSSTGPFAVVSCSDS